MGATQWHLSCSTTAYQAVQSHSKTLERLLDNTVCDNINQQQTYWRTCTKFSVWLSASSRKLLSSLPHEMPSTCNYAHISLGGSTPLL